MNPHLRIAIIAHETKPRSRGDEPAVKAIIQRMRDKTPLTRG